MFVYMNKREIAY